jgi:hypothetical protein
MPKQNCRIDRSLWLNNPARCCGRCRFCCRRWRDQKYFSMIAIINPIRRFLSIRFRRCHQLADRVESHRELLIDTGFQLIEPMRNGLPDISRSPNSAMGEEFLITSRMCGRSVQTLLKGR